MKTSVSQATAEARAVRKFNKLYIPLVELFDALQNLEPCNTLVDNVVLGRNEDGGVHVEYVAKPIRFTIRDKNKTMTLQVFRS